MAIISVMSRGVRNIAGDRKITHGKFSGAQSGGEVNTGLDICEHLQLQGTANTTAGSTRIVVNADFPRGGSAIPIITNRDVGGIWFAYGR